MSRQSSAKPKSRRRQQATLNRAAPAAFPPGGALTYLSPQQLQSIYGQTFYGKKLQNTPVGQTSLFSPGLPLPPQPGVNPNGVPVQWRYPISYNTFSVDRAMGNPDIPSFEVLRRMSRMYSGITLCERAWADMVPRMVLKIGLRPEYVKQGAQEKDYQAEIKYFMNFFARPDGQHDQHTWLRMMLREQTQIDELYLYKNRTRGGKLLGLQVVAGDQMKPLLDDWGHQPSPPNFAYQQYPWGIPGYQYTTDQIIHYQESPAADTPYGFSRVERFILEVNMALRKKKKDLAAFTEGNIPYGLVKVPGDAMWSQNDIDAYEQAFNSMMAGNRQSQVRLKFLQPGMEYQALEQYVLDPTFDKFLLNIAAPMYGLTMAELSFTEDVNKSSGESQEDVVYRRSIGPVALMYGLILTDIMVHDFPPEMHGDMLCATFGGFEETEDLESTATYYASLAGVGAIAPSDIAQTLHLPEVPKTGPFILTRDGPLFLKDYEEGSQLRTASTQATMAGLQLAAHPPDVGVQAQTADQDDETQKPPGGTPVSKSARTAMPEQQSGEKMADGGTHGANSEQKTAKTSRPPRSMPTGKPNKREVQRLLRSIEEWISSDDDDGEVEPTQRRNTGMMLAFLLDPATAAQLALPDGEDPADLHVTLAYLGNMDDATPPGKLNPAESRENLSAILRAFAASRSPIVGSTGGLGRFAPSDSSDGASPVIALVNAPDLQEWRRALVNAIESAGYSAAADFDYMPHITLAYIPPDAEMPVQDVPRLSLRFETLCLVIGDDRYYFPIGGGPHESTQFAPYQALTTTSRVQPALPDAAPGDGALRAIKDDYRRWRDRAITDARAGRVQRGFTTTRIPPDIHARISAGLARCTSADQVREVFRRAQEPSPPESELIGARPLLEYNARLDIWEPADTEQQLMQLRSQGKGEYLRWDDHPSVGGVCATCAPNVARIVKIGERFPGGHRLPQAHPGCQCAVTVVQQPADRA